MGDVYFDNGILTSREKRERGQQEKSGAIPLTEHRHESQICARNGRRSAPWAGKSLCSDGRKRRVSIRGSTRPETASGEVS